MDYSEDKIILSAKQGNKESFDILVRKYAKEVYNLCYRLSGNTTDAEDLSQNVLLKALQSIKDFQQKSSFSTWLHQIAVNLWIDISRKRKVLNFTSIDETIKLDGGEFQREFADSGLIAEQNMENKELEKIIKKSLDVLTPDQKIAIVLKYIEGKSLEEIAKICNCPIGTISARLTRGIKEMNKHLKPYIEPKQ
ncbi:MAG: sigma-70 family RNA polymerase sigma factor [Elusimicrobia bacterium]|nr:sigma-70 family RNA polymerase sigma factor [Elusimicrobiota bacterium]